MRTDDAPGESPVVVVEEGSVGIVATESITLPETLVLDGGGRLGPVTVAYETYGELDDRGENAILIEHALTASAHAAGRHRNRESSLGWWDAMIGRGRAFDTDRYFVICANILGSCYGTTGPSSTNPATGRPYGASFPRIGIRDMVRVQRALLERLGVRRIRCVCGGSMGGMQAIEWAVLHPEMVDSIALVATAARATPQSIAIHKVGIEAIFADPNWRGGDYYGQDPPRRGLAIARMLGHVTYLSDGWLWQKFGRRRAPEGDLRTLFEIERYLEHQGRKFVERFDANSYVHLVRAIDLYDAAEGYDTLAESFRRMRCDRALVCSFSADWLYPPYQSEELVAALTSAGVPAEYHAIESGYGHDSFLLEHEKLTAIVRDLLAQS
ncbi:MAG: homoserine O-acetyltransferase/O-succinyltransferase [Candidatus Binatota bacterium]|jgi:homoserine O-acetyltransferase|nr:homoserine O-acetyltransferase/O-succinyltransferase [Candidatus Binatota bacterium]